MDDSNGDRIGFFLLGAALGAAVALLCAPETGKQMRKRIRRKGEDVAGSLVDAGKDLVEMCEDLRERTEELAGDAAHELSAKYRDLAERGKQLAKEAASIIRST